MKKNNCKINKCMENVNYVKISNDVIQSKEISLAAKGLLVYILSLPSDWFLIKGDMYKQLGMTRRAVEKAFNELVAAGFITSNKTQTQGGWSYSYEIFSRFPNGINIQNNDVKEEFVDDIPTESEVEIEYKNKEVNDNNTMIVDNEIPNIPTEEYGHKETITTGTEELEEVDKDIDENKEVDKNEKHKIDWNDFNQNHRDMTEEEIIRAMPKEFAKKPTLADYGYPEEPTIVLRKKPIEKEEKDDDEEDYMKGPVWSDEEEALYRLNEKKTLGTYSKENEDISLLKSVVVQNEIVKHNLKSFLLERGYNEDFFKMYEEHKNGKEVNDPVFRAGLKWYDSNVKEFQELQQSSN